MISTDELKAIPFLASVAPEDMARLAQGVGDVRLAPGEYAVHEGDERALFVVLSGRIEVTKLIDGIERVIGARAPGQLFGEVPITFGTPFQGSYRAKEPSRVMQFGPAVPRPGRWRARRPDPRGRPGRRAHRRAARHRHGTDQGARTHGRPSLGRYGAGPADIPRPQPDLLRLDHARCARLGRTLARPNPRRRRPAGPGVRRRHHPAARGHSRSRRQARPADPAAQS